MIRSSEGKGKYAMTHLVKIEYRSQGIFHGYGVKEKEKKSVMLLGESKERGKKGIYRERERGT